MRGNPGLQAGAAVLREARGFPEAGPGGGSRGPGPLEVKEWARGTSEKTGFLGVGTGGGG